MRTPLCSVAFSLVFLTAGQAADLVEPVYVETGDLRLNSFDRTGFNAVLFAGGGFLTGSDSLGSDAFFRSGQFGGSIGYDHQFNQFVLGASVEGSLTNFRGISSSGNYRQSSDWLSAATVRVGYDVGRFMPYLSAGVGFGNYEIENVSNGSSDENTHVGYVLGAGIEANVTDQIIARVDYKHYEMGEETYTVSGLSPFTVDGKADMFNLGVGYRF